MKSPRVHTPFIEAPNLVVMWLLKHVRAGFDTFPAAWSKTALPVMSVRQLWSDKNKRQDATYRKINFFNSTYIMFCSWSRPGSKRFTLEVSFPY